MSAHQGELRESLRIIWAIAAKDVVDALKNRTFLSIIVGMAIVMLTGQAFPFLLGMSDTSPIYVYDPGGSRLVTALENSPDYQVRRAASQEEMETLLVELNAKVLGLVVPPDFDRMLDAGGQLQIEGYVTWSSRFSAPEMKAELEQTLTELLGQTVAVHVEGNFVYPSSEGSGFVSMVAIVLVLVTFVLGGFLVPYLMFEERQTHTMDALMVSPANVRQIVAGKAVAGLFYTLAGMAVAFAFYFSTFAHWGIAILAVLCGALLAIALGLLMGSVFETAQQMGFWAGLPLIILLLPLMLNTLVTRLPEPLYTVIYWFPTAAQGRAFLLSFSGDATIVQALPHLAVVLGSALPVYLLVAWRVRRLDR